LSDELEIVVALRSGITNSMQEMICEKLRGELKVLPAVRLADIAEIQAIQDSRELRKQRTFVDRRNK
jgi:hypothetical protein